jgi:hypothetical protein
MLLKPVACKGSSSQGLMFNKAHVQKSIFEDSTTASMSTSMLLKPVPFANTAAIVVVKHSFRVIPAAAAAGPQMLGCDQCL